ncbi:MAG: SRPBCC domain-containing protein, partial [Hyphomonas sp.]|nr:SRPBCC domain-containing protein [Hyphomonas sp.]
MTRLNTPSDSPWRDWPLDREIVIARVLDAPRDLVYAAWTDPAQIQQWFGPEGMAIETREI